MAFRREKKRIGDMLINENVITQEQLEKALPIAKEKHKKIGETLIELGFTNELEIAKALSQQLGLELVNVSALNIPEEVQSLVSESVLRKHVMIPYAFDPNNANIVHVAMADPMDMVALDDFSIVTNLQAEPAVATGRDILLTLDKYYGDTEAMKAAQEYARERKEREQKNAEAEEATSKDVNNSPVVLLVNSIIEQAARLRASDIHIEALENKVRVRYRIDGALYEKAAYSIHLLSAIITRLKIIGGMDISEKRKPQDGRITVRHNGQKVDLRVAALPTVWGEKIVMRILSTPSGNLKVEDLNFSERNFDVFSKAYNRPYGMVLVTGPTGSGKSTTLYATLGDVARPEINIITVEDPVEFRMEGINQVQVNNKAGMTFAAALRSILRADPDVVLIGEIRDEETATIAIEASLTGHLVLSTLHTNDAPSAVTRLTEMGVEPFLVSSSLAAVMAQRLARRLCKKCRKADTATPVELKMMGVPYTPGSPLPTVYRAMGCRECSNTGYHGRVAIQQVMGVDTQMEDLIARGATSLEIEQAAKSKGMTSLREDGWQKVLQGITSVDEVLRVTV